MSTARQDSHLTVEQDLALRWVTIGTRPRVTRAAQRREALAQMADRLLEDPHVREAVRLAIECQIERAVQMLTDPSDTDKRSIADNPEG